MYIPMIDAALPLQTAATHTASTNCPWLDFGKGFKPKSLGEVVAAVITVTAIKTTAGNETYAFKVQEADDDGTGSPDAATVRDAGFSVSPTAVGVTLAKAVISTRFVRLVLTVSGTAPSITYSANVGR